MINTANPDVFRKNYDNDEKLQEVLSQGDDDEIRFSQWKRVSVEKDGKVFKKMKLIDLVQSSMEFTEGLKADFKLFSEHAARVKQQYEQIRHPKLHLHANHVIAQMDFAQNYTCQALEEIQSSYWDQSEQVTLHPVVFYYKRNDEELLHKSSVIVSDCLSHNASTVIAFLQKVIVPKAKEVCPDVTFVHY